AGDPTAASTPYAASGSDIELAKRVASLLSWSPPITKSSGPLYTDPRSTAGNYVNKVARGSDARPLLSANDVRAAARAARDEYVAKLVDAWKAPSRAAAPDNGDDDDDDNGGNNNGNNNDDPQARKDAAWKLRNAQLENAWRRTDPN